MSRQEWEIEQERRKFLQDRLVTEMKKNKFISEIKNGLGKEIVKKTNTIQKKPSLLYKIKKLLGWI